MPLTLNRMGSYNPVISKSVSISKQYLQDEARKDRRHGNIALIEIGRPEDPDAAAGLNVGP